LAKTITERADILPRLAEIFREYGYEGASLAIIGARTGLGKGSLYHFFPGGKEEMAAAVIDEIGQWFEHRIYEPLRSSADPQAALMSMCDDVSAYFHSGRRICLIGAFALDNVRDRFAARVNDYFAAWRSALADALQRRGDTASRAETLSEDTLIAIQGALVLARALDQPELFQRSMDRIRADLSAQAT
jgi:TetR/AcrR family transcriptional regulator, lmrAB and yxaGH operons repressor